MDVSDFIDEYGSEVTLHDGTTARAIKDNKAAAMASSPAVALGEQMISPVVFHFKPDVEGHIAVNHVIRHRSQEYQVRTLDFVEKGDTVVTITAICDPLSR